MPNEDSSIKLSGDNQRQLTLFDFAPRKRQAQGLAVIGDGKHSESCPPVSATNSSGERMAVTDNRERIVTCPKSSLLTLDSRTEYNDRDTCQVPFASHPVFGGNHIPLHNNILMHDGWQRRPLSLRTVDPPQ